MEAIFKKIKSEPAFVGGLLNLIVPALVIFEIVQWDGQQVGTLTGIIGFITGVGVRQVVSPANATGGDQDDMPDIVPDGVYVESDLPEV